MIGILQNLKERCSVPLDRDTGRAEEAVEKLVIRDVAATLRRHNSQRCNVGKAG
jgi:hypothetical protein